MSDEKTSQNKTAKKQPPAASFFPAAFDKEKITRFIWWLIGLVVGCNVVAVCVYASQRTLADYFDSKSYEALLATLLIPLLLSLIAQAFKIDEKVEAEKLQREQKQEAAELLAKELIRKRQTDTLEKTNAMWSELYRLSTEVAYFKAGQDAGSIRETRKKLECLINSAEEMLNLWYLNFPQVVLEVQEQALNGLNLLLLSALTVADMVEDKKRTDAKEMQNCLLVIQDGVRFGLHYSLMQIFHYAMEDKKFDLQNQMSQLAYRGKIFKELLRDQPPNLPLNTLADSPRKLREEFLADYQAKCTASKAAWDQMSKKITHADRDDEKEQIVNSAEFGRMWAAFGQAEKSANPSLEKYRQAVKDCPPNLLGVSRKQVFSDDQIKQFTAAMFLETDLIRLKASV